MGTHAPRAGDWIVLYGSLMRGIGALEALGLEGKLRFAGPCRCPGTLFDLGDYPGLRPGHDVVIGELHAVLEPAAFEILDDFEDYAPDAPRTSLYLRERVTLEAPRGVVAWVYVYNRIPDATRRIPSGDWRAHLAARSREPVCSD
jgi:gamma-glutamylcyclotransferase (GGCT)/AIG2-like uncharacterized protein YtfP